MIKALRKKFVRVSMLSVAIVILFVVLALNFTNYRQIYSHPRGILALLVDNGGIFPTYEPQKYDKKPRDISPDARFTARYFSVRITEAGAVYHFGPEHFETMTKDLAFSYAKEVQALGKNRGELGDYLYERVPYDGGTLLVFVNSQREQEMVGSFFINTLWISGICLLAVGFLVVVFSKNAIRPIVEGYEKQKQFITDASHELKTPLAIISTNAEVLEIENEDSPWVASIQNQTARLSHLVNQLVTLARMDEPGGHDPKKYFDLAMALEEEIKKFKALDDQVDVSIHQEGLFYGDEGAIRQMFSILIDNALKYHKPESTIRVKLFSKGKKIFFSMENQAIGITKGDLSLFLERFYRPDASRNSQLGGHGIGLSIVKAIVEKHSGKIHIFSPEDEVIKVEILL